MDQPDPMPLSCADCAAKMPETAAFCPGCGRPMTSAVKKASGRVGALPERIAGALAYLTFVPAILFLVIEPYKKNHFVRFHSIQCLLLWVLGALVAIVLKLAGLVLFVIPVVGPLFVVLVMVLALLAAAAIWLVLVVKALQGEKFKLPLLGDFAELNADVA